MSQSEETKIAVMQEKINTLDKNIDAVMTNHLPHIQDEIKSLRDEIAALKITLGRYIGISIGAIAVIQIALKFITVK